VSIKLPLIGDPIRAADLAEIARVAGHRHSGPGVTVSGENVTFLPPPPSNDRTYKRFTLTETLNAGSHAYVTWPDGSIGIVYDYDTCCWGLTGEQGEAYLTSDTSGNGFQWIVCKNPGQGCYYGALTNDTTSSPCNVLITIASTELTLSCVMRRPPDVGEKYAATTGVYVGHFRGSWEIVSILECAVPV